MKHGMPIALVAEDIAGRGKGNEFWVKVGVFGLPLVLLWVGSVLGGFAAAQGVCS